MTDQELEQLTRNACFAVDAMASGLRDLPAAIVTRMVLREALMALEDTGLIAVTPWDDWPEGFKVGPLSAQMGRVQEYLTARAAS